MSIPKLAGIETEYAITGSDPVSSSRGVVGAYARLQLSADNTSCVYRDQNDLMLANGGRLYVDHAHPEFSTAESQNPATVVALDRAGTEIVRRCAELISEDAEPIRLYKNNSDHQGNSYGCHENYLMEADAYVNLFDDRSRLIYTHLAPFLISRLIYTGAGKVGAENGTPAVAFQVSQRADFLEAVVGLQTTYNRPIINSRDEPHADPKRFRRLHLIPGDANMCPYAAWLKIGVTQMVLRLLEDDAIHGNLALEDPIEAMVQISHDPACSKAVRLESGRTMSAIEMQSEFLSFAQRYFEMNVPSEVEIAILSEWQKTLTTLSRDPQELMGRIDWVTKRDVLRAAGAANRWEIDSAQAVAADVLYHALDPSESLFNPLEELNLITFPPGWDASAPKRFLTNPPEDSRAWFRGKCIATFGAGIVGVDWGEIRFDKVRLVTHDPLEPRPERVRSLFDQNTDVESFLDSIDSRLEGLRRERVSAG